jgi:putative glutamine amidotransferase
MPRKEKFVLEITPQDCYWPFKQWGRHTTNYDILWSDAAKDVSLLVFTGGTDVDPALYGEKMGSRTGHPDKYRDKHESACFKRAVELGIPMVGICRGSQFVCVMSGGKLVQDVTKHGGYHGLRTHDGNLIECNSTHHQMQLPPEGARILALAEPKLSTHYWNGDDQEIEVPGDVEVVFYPNTKSIGIQYHPEWLEKDHPCVEYARRVVEEFLIPKKK